MSQGSFHKWLLEMNSKKSAKVPLLVGHAFTFWEIIWVSMDIPIVWEIQNPCCGKSIFGLQLLWEIHICSELVGCLGMVLLVELTTNNTCPVGTWKPVMALHLLKPYLYVYIHIMWDIGECIIVLWIEGNPWKPHSIHWIVFPHLCPHPFFPHFSITLEVHLPSMIWNRASTSSPSISSVRCRRPCASTKRISPGAVSSESCSSMVLMASASNFNWKLPSNDLKKEGDLGWRWENPWKNRSSLFGIQECWKQFIFWGGKKIWKQKWLGGHVGHQPLGNGRCWSPHLGIPNLHPTAWWICQKKYPKTWMI